MISPFRSHRSKRSLARSHRYPEFAHGEGTLRFAPTLRTAAELMEIRSGKESPSSPGDQVDEPREQGWDAA